MEPGGSDMKTNGYIQSPEPDLGGSEINPEVPEIQISSSPSGGDLELGGSEKPSEACWDRTRRLRHELGGTEIATFQIKQRPVGNLGGSDY